MQYNKQNTFLNKSTLEFLVFFRMGQPHKKRSHPNSSDSRPPAKRSATKGDSAETDLTTDEASKLSNKTSQESSITNMPTSADVEVPTSADAEVPTSADAEE